MSATIAPVPVYFEESWAILSSICLVNVLFGFMVIGITALTPISIVPIVCSVAGAIANGLCYYAFYAHHPITNTVIAAAVADVSWCIQEGGLSFYSYLILIRVLKGRSRTIFMSLFWSGIVIIVAVRTGILTERARDILQNTTDRQSTIDHLHNVYFGTIALVECNSAFFLLRKLAFAHKSSIEAASGHKLFVYLMRSTEIRVAMLALIGFSRTITYSFQTTAQSATSTMGQLDRFVVTLECLFPEMMFIDILASRLIFGNRNHESSTQSRSQHFTNSQNHKNITPAQGFDDIPMYPVGHVETRVDARGIVSTSQEQIIDRSVSRFEGRSSGEESQHKGAGGNIVKTVEFEFHDSAV
ncbi:hypothetical protein V8E51_005347 [Hyaloscypha variabilis]